MINKIDISSEIKEQDLIEHCLNLHNSGYEYMFLLAFHAFAQNWKIEKILYYKKLIEGGKKNEC